MDSIGGCLSAVERLNAQIYGQLDVYKRQGSIVIITAPEIRDRILMVTVQAVLQAALIVMARDRKKTGRDQQEHTVIRYRCHS